MSRKRSEQKYSYKTDFEIWRANQDSVRQNISWVDHLLTRLVLVLTLPTTQRHQLTRFMSEQKRQTPHHKHDQQSCQHDQRIIQSEK